MCHQTHPFVIDIGPFPSRFYLLPHEAIVDELEESNYEESVRYLKELFELDEETRREAGPDTLTWKKPRLKDNRDAMLRLRKGLIAVERAKSTGARKKKNLKYKAVFIVDSYIILSTISRCYTADFIG